MTDRGETIINLARELLSADCTVVAPAQQTPSPTPKKYGIMVGAAFTMMLSAIGGATLTAWSQEQQRLINHYEKTQIEALLYYAAKTRKLNQDSLRQDVLKQYHIEKISDMTVADFARARLYLHNKIDQ